MKITEYQLIALLLMVISPSLSLANSSCDAIGKAIDHFDSGRYISFETPLENGLINAIRDNNCAQALEYIERGVNINQRDGFHKTFLHVLAHYPKGLPIAKALLDKGLDPSSKGNNLYTPLHSAVYEGNEELIRLLIKYKADVDAQDHIGNTPLHMAVARAEVRIVKQLLEAGANVHLANSMYDDTPLHQVAKGIDDFWGVNSKRARLTIKKQTEIARLLIAAGAKKDAKNRMNKTSYGAVVNRWFDSDLREMNPQTKGLVQELMNLLRPEPVKPTK